MIPESFIEEVKARNDIYEVLSQFIHVEKKGKNAWACCPFHNEKTASFCINLQDQYYKCFGCGERGNVIGFLMNYEKMTYVEAITWLAKRVHMEVPETASDPKEKERKRRFDTMRAAMTEAAKYYYGTLKTDVGASYLGYWQSRGLDNKTITYFGLGAAPDGFGLIKRLTERGYDTKTMLAVGLTEEKNGRALDAQRGRVVVPIIDPRGQVVAFGGRILDNKGFAKYKNTTNTELFIKSNLLYNLNRLKEQSTRAVILVEGYMDVISLYQAGFVNAVAPMGTAFTAEQCALLKKYADLVYVSFDGDAAGRKATDKAIDLLEKYGFEVKVVSPPGELDPDEIIKKYGVEGFSKCLNEALPRIDYKLKTVEETYPPVTFDGRTKYTRASIEVLNALDAVQREVYIPKVAEKARVSAETLKAEIAAGAARKLQTEPMRQVKKEENVQDYSVIDKGLISAARFVLGAFFKINSFEMLSELNENCFVDEKHKKVYRYIIKCRENAVVPTESAIYDVLENDSEAKLIMNEFESVPKTKEAKYFSECISKLLVGYFSHRQTELSKAYAESKEDALRDDIKKEIQKTLQMQVALQKRR